MGTQYLIVKKENKAFRGIKYCVPIIIGLITTTFAADIGFEVTVDRTKASLANQVQLNLTFSGTQDVAPPELPEIEGFGVRYLGPSRSMSIINGSASSSITHRYVLIPLRVGRFTIGPFSFEYKGEMLTSKAISVEVVEGMAARGEGGQGSDDRERGLEDYVFLVMEPDKTTAYVNEIIPLRIKLYVHSFTLRDIDYPTFLHEGFAVDTFTRPLQYQEIVGGITYDVIEFNTSLFGTRPGEFILGPAELTSNLLVKKQGRRTPYSLFDDFFGRYETHPLTLKAAEVTMTVLPLPGQGKPAMFEGALGSFQFDIEAEPRELKVGDPITLKMAISGKGNFDTVSLPKLKDEQGFKLYDPEVKKDENKKIFERVIIPTDESIKAIPEISFSFFDLERDEYRTITKSPIPITVTKAPGEGPKIVELPSAARDTHREILGRDIIYIKESLGRLEPKGRFLYNNKGFLSLPLLLFLVLASIFILHKRSEKIRSDTRYARLLKAPKRAKRGINRARELLVRAQKEEFYDFLFKTLQEYLGDKFHLSSGGITVHIVYDILAPLGLDKAMLKKLEDTFKEFDEARFAPSALSDAKMNELLTQVEEIIDYLERTKL